MERKFGIGESLRFAWERFKSEWKLVVGGFVVVGLAAMLPQFMAQMFEEDLVMVGVLLVIFGMIVQVIVGAGWLKLLLMVVDGKKPTLEVLFSTTHLFVKLVAGSVLYMLVVMLGMLLLVIPGFVWGIKYQFFYYFIVDREMGVFESFHASGEATRGNKLKLLALGFVLGLVQILGMLAIGLGLLVTGPVAGLAKGYVYRKLSGTMKEKAQK